MSMAIFNYRKELEAKKCEAQANPTRALELFWQHYKETFFTFPPEKHREQSCFAFIRQETWNGDAVSPERAYYVYLKRLIDCIEPCGWSAIYSESYLYFAEDPLLAQFFEGNAEGRTAFEFRSTRDDDETALNARKLEFIASVNSYHRFWEVISEVASCAIELEFSWQSPSVINERIPGEPIQEAPAFEWDGNNYRLWVFRGGDVGKISGVFTTKLLAEEWIHQHRLSGTLRAYPVNMGVYDWAISREFLVPKNDFERSPEFIADCVRASQEYYVYEDGKRY
jgi:hypothetical protein